jgi:hypothetical protein
VGVLTQLVDEGRELASQQRCLKPISMILEEVKGTINYIKIKQVSDSTSDSPLLLP